MDLQRGFSTILTVLLIAVTVLAAGTVRILKESLDTAYVHISVEQNIEANRETREIVEARQREKNALENTASTSPDLDISE